MTPAETPQRRVDIAGLRRILAAKYPKVRAALGAAGAGAAPALRQQAMLCAVCADDQDAAMAIAREFLPNVPPLRPLRLAPLATLADYCREHGLACTTAVAPLQVEIPPTERYPVPASYTTEPALFASIPRAQFIPGWDFVIGEDDSVLHDTGYMPPGLATGDFMTFHVGALNCLIHHAPAEERYVDEEVLFLSAPRNSVGHWMVDFLPRLKGLEQLSGRKVKLALPANLHPRYAEMLFRFGVTPDDIVSCAPGVRHRFKMCHVYKPGPCEPPNPVHVRFVREGLLRGEVPKKRSGKKVFLGRSSVGTRMIANRAEFEHFLAREGITAVDPADLDFAAQKELLADADVILGPFGSNLFGMYLAPADCTVVVLMNAALEDPIFAATAALFGMKPRHVLCATAPESAGVREKDRDIVVDCAALAGRLRDGQSDALLELSQPASA
ncbi:MAG: glycosyltransferase family 61 protein [Rhodospirillaceae bacterium]|nr:glycosyltransferase family 61 protein [Rhodospirillaceae bacterium]